MWVLLIVAALLVISLTVAINKKDVETICLLGAILGSFMLAFVAFETANALGEGRASGAVFALIGTAMTGFAAYLGIRTKAQRQQAGHSPAGPEEIKE